MEKEIKPFVKVPNKMTELTDLQPKDLVIYANLVRYADRENVCYPSLTTISSESGAAINTVRKCLNNLVKAGYIAITKQNNHSNTYTILKRVEGFEMFSKEFLDNKNLSFIEKAYLIASQQYMFLNIDASIGTIKFTSTELSDKINMPYSSLRACQKSLEKKELMQVLTDGSKTYNLDKFNTAVVYKLKEHEDEILELKRENRNLRKELNSLQKEIREIKKSTKLIL